MIKLPVCNRLFRIVLFAALCYAAMTMFPLLAFAEEAVSIDQFDSTIMLVQDEQSDALDDQALRDVGDQGETTFGNELSSAAEEEAHDSVSQESESVDAKAPAKQNDSTTKGDSKSCDPDNTALIAAEDTPKFEDTHVNVYRMYNPNSGEHFYTTGLGEAKRLASVGWQWEGIGWTAPKSGSPVYRLYNPNTGDHHYTTSANERDSLAKKGWRKEGVSWYSDGKDQIALYRLYNPNAKSGTHMITTSKSEYDALGKKGWRREGISSYVSKGSNIVINGFWLVTRAWGSLDRYWVASNGNIAKNRLIETKEGSGYLAYAKGNGAVVRGKWDNGQGYVYVATQDGRLASTSNGKDGWLVTKAYDGDMQRYYYIASRHAMRQGFFTIDNKPYYGADGAGYVARGKYKKGNFMLLADNNGVLQTGTGWFVSKKFDGGMQRYFLDTVQKGYSGAKIGLFTVSGKKYYGNTVQGYVQRNEYVYADRWYKANNDGVLTASESPQEGELIRRAQGMSSRTNTLVLVDTTGCNFGVFTGSKGNWKLVRFEKCVTGTTSTPTIKGTYSLGYHLPSLPAWPNALYCTNISGGYFFHSILGSTSELGKRLSHGCVRLNWPTAQYVQSLPYGSTVNLY